MRSPVEKGDDSGSPVNNTPSHLKSTSPSSQNQEKLELLSDSEHHSSNLRPWRIDDDMSFWQTYITEAEKFDKEMVDGWNRSLDNLLVFSPKVTNRKSIGAPETQSLTSTPVP
ncbi:hypothetical protein FRC02_004661 [Tulasnella sp. 418]|nr:hypothetical protein FRC02_004661 [Tulasnella sp. 418]